LYTVVTVLVFAFASGLFLAYAHVVEQRQRTMTEKVIENIMRAAETERELNEFLRYVNYNIYLYTCVCLAVPTYLKHDIAVLVLIHAPHHFHE